MKQAACWIFALLVLLPSTTAFAKKDWESEEGYKRLLRGEAKVLAPLVEEAVKKDYRRQAWYLADRLLACNPDSTQAIEVIEKWDGAKLRLGEPVKKGFLSKMVNTLRGIGDAYFHFGETLEAAGVDPIDYYKINLRAQSYGSQAGPLIASMKQGGFTWLGTYGHEEEKAVTTLLGQELVSEVTFPPEWDDEFLKFRVNWPEARVVECDRWRLITNYKYDQALRALRRIVEVERWAIKRMGKGKPDSEKTTIAFFSNHEHYEKLAPDMVRERYGAALRADTGYYVANYRRAFVADVDGKHPWIGELANLQGMVLKSLAYTRYAKGKGKRIDGPGEWLLASLRGLGEGLMKTDAKSFDMALEPKRSWRLAAARALRDGEQQLGWIDVFAMSEKGRRSAERAPALEIYVNETKRAASNVDKVAAQATAFPIAVLLSNRKKGGKLLAKLLEGLFKAGRLDAPWTALKWKPTKLREELARALDAVVVPK